MRIIEAEFREFGKHKYLHETFSEGLVGVWGANGSGKTTLVNGIYAVLTNDFSRFDGGKAGIINDMMEDKAVSMGRVVFEHNGEIVEVCRTLYPKSTSWLKHNGERITSVAEIQSRLTSLLGVPVALLDKYVFVRQLQMTSLLSETPAVRAETFRQLCGLTDTDKIYKAITAEMDTLDAQLAMDVDQSAADSARSQQAAAKQELAELAVQIAEKEQLLPSAEDEATLSETLRQLQRRQSLRQQFSSLKSQAKKLLASQPEQPTALEEQAAAIAAEHQELQQEERIWRRWQEYERERQRLGRQIARITGDQPQAISEEDVAEAKQRYDTQLAANTKKQRELTALQNWLEEVEKDLAPAATMIECPKCAYVWNGVNERKEQEFQQRKQQLPALRQEAHKSQKQLDAVCSEFQDKRLQLESFRRAEAQLVDLHNDLAELKKPAATPDEAKVGHLTTEQAWTQALRDTAAKEKAIQQQLKTARNAVSEHAGKLKENQEQQAQVKAAYKPLAALAGDLEALQQELAAQQERRTELAVLKNQQTAAKNTIRQAQTTIDFVERQLAAFRRKRQARQTLGLVAAEYKWNGAPQRVSQSRLQQLEAGTNHYLQWLGSPFIAQVSQTQELAFDLELPGEVLRPATALSGGQQSIFSIALRVASSTTFGADLGLLVMDEPTVSLDAANIKIFAEALQRLATELRENRQVIIVTHTPELLPGFDQTITL